MAADSASASESRPPVWAGHVGPHPDTELERWIDFFVALGGRLAVHQPPIASIELRGGTHIVLQLADEVDEKLASLPPAEISTTSASWRQSAGTVFHCGITSPVWAPWQATCQMAAGVPLSLSICVYCQGYEL